MKHLFIGRKCINEYIKQQQYVIIHDITFQSLKIFILHKYTIPHPEESHRLWCIVACDLETSWMRRPWPTGDCRAKKQTKVHHINYLTSLHAIPNSYIKLTHTFTVMCLKYSTPNNLITVGISITLAPHINMQHAVVSYETLHKCLFLFNIAQPIRMLQQATTLSVTLCTVLVDIFSKKCNVRMT